MFFLATFFSDYPRNTVTIPQRLVYTFYFRTLDVWLLSKMRNNQFVRILRAHQRLHALVLDNLRGRLTTDKL